MNYLDVGAGTATQCQHTPTYLEIRDYGSSETQYTIVDTICGHKLPKYTYRIPAQKVEVRFETDGVGGQGFVFTYKWTMDHLIRESYNYTLTYSQR